MQESRFHQLADSWLTSAQDALEDADMEGVLDIDCAHGSLTITLESGQVLLVSKHTPSRQLWLSSPISGGLHFGYDEKSKQWILANGCILPELLAKELQSLSGITVSL